jgi:hypothetical protein
MNQLQNPNLKDPLVLSRKLDYGDNFTLHDIDTSKHQAITQIYQRELYKDKYSKKAMVIWMWIGMALTAALTLYSLGIIIVLLFKAFIQIVAKGAI